MLWESHILNSFKYLSPDLYPVAIQILRRKKVEKTELSFANGTSQNIGHDYTRRLDMGMFFRLARRTHFVAELIGNFPLVF